MEASDGDCVGQVDANADKLDCMMCLVFQHLERRVAASDFKQVWRCLASGFFASVLSTHRSKFTQYIMWYLCKEVGISLPSFQNTLS